MSLSAADSGSTSPQLKQWRILRLPEVVDRIGLCAESIRRLELKGQFPRRIHLTPRSIGYLEAHVDAWLADRLAQRAL